MRSTVDDDRPKKALSHMSLAELDREEKITSIKLARIKMEKLQESINKYKNLNENFEVVVEATHGMIEMSRKQLSKTPI